ncbi:MAG: VanZ family protein [Christensenellaceae bacterium]|jgi:glycopeptide antibiotics resistance protein|nr:VanZ family protein [Christensenellaceae bacterium]
MNKPAEAKNDIITRLIFGMGIGYLLFLIWAILWKCGLPFWGDGTLRALNLLPLNGNARWELQFNIAVFVPLGFYISAIKPNWPLLKRVLAALLTSFLLEAVQFALAIGRSDITDLLMNTLGGIVGITAFCALAKLLGKHARKAIFVVCVLLTLLTLYMTVSFIRFGQLNIGFMIIKMS